MAQAVSRLTAESRVSFRLSPCGICDGRAAVEHVFSSFLFFSVNIIPLWLSILIYHLGDRQ
jgi:hypothetical protein